VALPIVAAESASSSESPIPKHASVIAKGIDEDKPPPGLVSDPRARATPASIIFRAGANFPSLRKKEAAGMRVATTPERAMASMPSSETWIR